MCERVLRHSLHLRPEDEAILHLLRCSESDLAGQAWGRLGHSRPSLLAFAVSKTADPRDGFRIWFWKDNKRIADWPNIAVNGDNFIVTHRTEQSGKPLAYVFSVAAMLQGESSLTHWTYNAADL